MQECLKNPPEVPAKPKSKRTRAASAWSTAGCTIKQPGPMRKSLLERFMNPIVKVSIKTGAVLVDRVDEYLRQ
ncbi:MAG: hypothetical protein M1609_07625 [Firmicutes bacterium]|nr:hypothetical protein [Bacillota bacterium]